RTWLPSCARCRCFLSMRTTPRARLRLAQACLDGVLPQITQITRISVVCNNQRDSMRRLLYSLFIVITIVTGCHRDSTQPSDTFTTQLAGYEPMVIPPDNPMTPENVALGRQLFFDERLSFDGSRSCYSCHVCEHGLTDG